LGQYEISGGGGGRRKGEILKRKVKPKKKRERGTRLRKKAGPLSSGSSKEENILEIHTNRIRIMESCKKEKCRRKLSREVEVFRRPREGRT